MLLKLADDILNGMEAKSISSMVALDLSAAFDTVNHTILIKTFQNYYGISNKVLRWINSFLTNRTCCVSINGQMSAKKELTLSVPQGGCSSAFYFIMYAATLFDVVPDNLHLYGFADDHIICAQTQTAEWQKPRHFWILKTHLLTFRRG